MIGGRPDVGKTPLWQNLRRQRLRVAAALSTTAGHVWLAVDYQTQVQHEEPPTAAGRQTAVAQARHYRDRARPVEEHTCTARRHTCLADRAHSPSQREQFCRQLAVWLDCLLSSTKEAVVASRHITKPDIRLTRTDVRRMRVQRGSSPAS